MPDVHATPIPRFDLLRFKDYLSIGIQYSRGCPFNCEFCDIIELYGRKPRTKTGVQMVAELQALYDLGYRGSVDIVDDNFIGNKRLVKRDLLPELITWSRKLRHPFFFNTEASLNMADDRRLLRQMRAAQFKTVFVGIESPDPEILLNTQKSQNTMRPIIERVQRIYEYGMYISAGFIIGFDGEKKGVDRSMIACIEQTDICMAMLGLLVALPNTQLTRRLQREGRLMSLQGERVTDANAASQALVQDESYFEGEDQMTSGLNFATQRDRKEVLSEYLNVINHVYDPKIYAARALRLAKVVKVNVGYLPRLGEAKRLAKGLINLCWAYTLRRSSRQVFWLTFMRALRLGPFRLEIVMRMMGLYLHFEKQKDYTNEKITAMIANSDQLMERFYASKQVNTAKGSSIPPLRPTSAEANL